MALVPGGPFHRGVNDPRGPDEGPERTLRLRDYFLDIHEVSNARFAEFVEATGYVTEAERDPAAVRSWRRPGADGLAPSAAHPVVHATWEDAHAYCAWRGRRLPTEAEWEKAARGGDDRQWPWGGTLDATRANGWGDADPYPTTSPVGAFPAGASPYGVLDLAGNVWEWCADWYDPDAYIIAAQRDPQGPSTGKLRVARGGSWTNPITVLRTSNRHAVHPSDSGPNLGFRCADSR